MASGFWLLLGYLRTTSPTPTPWPQLPRALPALGQLRSWLRTPQLRASCSTTMAPDSLLSVSYGHGSGLHKCYVCSSFSRALSVFPGLGSVPPRFQLPPAPQLRPNLLRACLRPVSLPRRPSRHRSWLSADSSSGSNCAPPRLRTQHQLHSSRLHDFPHRPPAVRVDLGLPLPASASASTSHGSLSQPPPFLFHILASFKKFSSFILSINVLGGLREISQIPLCERQLTWFQSLLCFKSPHLLCFKSPHYKIHSATSLCKE